MAAVIRIEVSAVRHKKFQNISKDAFCFWVAALCHSREQTTDGYLDERDLDHVRWAERGKKRRQLIDELVAAKLWEVRGPGWLIHDYDHWNDTAQQVEADRAAARERMATLRRKKRGGSPEQGEMFGRTSEEVRSRSDQIRSDQRSPDPVDLRSGGAESADPGPETAAPVPDPQTPREPSDDPRERPMALDWQPHPVAVQELAQVLHVPTTTIEGWATEFRSYWTIGAGMGQPRSHWQKKFREQCRLLALRLERGDPVRGLHGPARPATRRPYEQQDANERARGIPHPVASIKVWKPPDWTPDEELKTK